MLRSLFTLFSLCIITVSSVAANTSGIRFDVPPSIYDQSHPQQETTEKILTQVKSHLKLPENPKVISFNCETGKMSKYIAGEWLKGADVTTVCFNEDYANYTKANYSDSGFDVRVGDITQSQPDLENSADLIVSSWLGTYIPAKKHKQGFTNMYQSLKSGGHVVFIFPQKGSLLSSVIKGVVKSAKWSNQFNTFKIRRHNFSNKYFSKMVKSAGFEDVETTTFLYQTQFKTEKEFKTFIHTAIGRYIAWLQPDQVDEFIDDVANEYYSLIGFMGRFNIPYKVNMSVTIAKKA